MQKVNDQVKQQDQVNQSQPLATERSETLRDAQGDGVTGYVLPERYARWRGAVAVYAWAHPSWDARLILPNGGKIEGQRKLAAQYLGDGESAALLTFQLIPLPKAAFTELREFDG